MQQRVTAVALESISQSPPILIEHSTDVGDGCLDDRCSRLADR